MPNPKPARSQRLDLHTLAFENQRKFPFSSFFNRILFRVIRLIRTSKFPSFSSFLLLCFSAFTLLSFSTSTAFAQSASLSWSDSSLSIPQNQQDAVTIRLNTNGQLTTGLDAVMSFNPQIIDIQPILTATPAIYPVNFYLKPPTTSSTQTLRLTSSGSQTSESFFGESDYVHFIIRAKQIGQTQITFTCNPGSTNDTNVAQSTTSQDILDCNSLSPLTVTVTSPISQQSEESDDSSNQNNSSDNSDNDFGGYYHQEDESCSLPATPQSLTAQTVNPTTILLSWNGSSDASNYSLLYGPNPNSYQHGINQIGNTDQFAVNLLQPGTTYYFALFAENDCGVSGFATTSKRTVIFDQTPELPLNETELKSIASVESIIRTPPAPPISQANTPTPQTPDFDTPSSQETFPADLPGYQNPDTDSQTDPDFWLQIAILLIPLLIISLLVSLLFFAWKRNRRDGNIHPEPSSSSPPIGEPKPRQTSTNSKPHTVNLDITQNPTNLNYSNLTYKPPVITPVNQPTPPAGGPADTNQPTPPAGGQTSEPAGETLDETQSSGPPAFGSDYDPLSDPDTIHPRG